jgi:predicted ATPase
MISKLRVTNIGTIKRAEDEFKDLTIICGRNGVGKTYLSYTQYIIAKRFQYALAKSIYIPDSVRGAVHELAFEERSRFKHTFSLEYLSEVFDTARNTLRSEQTKRRVLDALDLESKENSTVEAFFNENPFSKVYEYSGMSALRISDEGRIEVYKEADSYDLNITIQNTGEAAVDPESLLDDIQFIFSIFVIEEVLRIRLFAITSERTGISYFQDLLTSQLRKNIYGDRVDDDGFGAISEPIRDNISTYRTIKASKYPYNHWMHKNKKALIGIVSDIVGGEYETEKGKFFFRPKGQNKRVPLRSSSGASKALLLIDYFIWKYHNYGSLIIDEPELNLHLDNQKAMARLLCAIANLGVQVVVTTHSDHFIREVNNLIMLSSPKIKPHEKQAIMKKGGVKQLSVIKPENVSTVVISSTTKVTHKMEVGEYGIDLNLFNDEILKGNEITNELIMTIYGSED